MEKEKILYSRKDNGFWYKSKIDITHTPPVEIQLETTDFEKKFGFTETFYKNYIK